MGRSLDTADYRKQMKDVVVELVFRARMIGSIPCATVVNT